MNQSHSSSQTVQVVSSEIFGMAVFPADPKLHAQKHVKARRKQRSTPGMAADLVCPQQNQDRKMAPTTAARKAIEIFRNHQIPTDILKHLQAEFYRVTIFHYSDSFRFRRQRASIPT